MSIADDQISRQIVGSTLVEVHFSDAVPDYITLYDQNEMFIRPAWCEPRKISRELADELISQFTGEQQFNTDPEVIRSNMRYDDFYNRYYNNA